MPRVLVIVSAAILLILGSAHLRLRFFGDQLTPREPSRHANMQQISPVITSETTMWKAWVGFNVSHSMGSMLFGLLYGYFAYFHPNRLFGSWFLLGLGVCVLGVYVWLGIVYWFSAPLTQSPGGWCNSEARSWPFAHPRACFGR